MNHLQAEQMLGYIRSVIEGRLYYVDSISAIEGEEKKYHMALLGTEMPEEGFPRSLSIELNTSPLILFFRLIKPSVFPSEVCNNDSYVKRGLGLA